ncbi:MAG: transposase [Herminiimonas sp.]|nr:transposase [Herminiimonas sp.]
MLRPPPPSHRNVIKRFFAQRKQFRRVATGYAKLASRFE